MIHDLQQRLKPASTRPIAQRTSTTQNSPTPPPCKTAGAPVHRPPGLQARPAEPQSAPGAWRRAVQRARHFWSISTEPILTKPGNTYPRSSIWRVANGAHNHAPRCHNASLSCSLATARLWC